MLAGSLLVIAVLLVPGQGAPARPDDSRLAAESQRGKELMAAGRYAEAVPVYRDLVRARPGTAGLLLNLGMALHLSGQDRDAVPQLEAALRIQPDSLPANVVLGAANMGLQRYQAAVAPLQRAVRAQPDNVEARSLLAQALLGLQRPAEAAPHLRRLAQLVPKDPAAWFNLGQIYEELAGHLFEELLERDPESPFVLALVAEVRAKEENREAAFHLYRQAVQRAPELRGAHAALGRIYRASGHPDWAAVEEERERRLGKPDCVRQPLECAFAEGRYADVISGAAAVRTPQAEYWRIRAYGELATRAFDTLAALPPSVHSHEWAAQVQRGARHYAESAAEWRKALALAPGDPRLLTELATTLRMSRDLTGAQRAVEQALKVDPDFPQANFLLGDVLLAQDQPQRAIPFLEKSVRGEPEEPVAHGALGRAYALVGRPADAIIHLEQALPADGDGSLRLQLARAYQAAGQRERAQAAMKDYEDFRKEASPEAGDSAPRGPAITPPDGVAPPPR
jgi:tetratricopeptide (TPR) repeat protein